MTKDANDLVYIRLPAQQASGGQADWTIEDEPFQQGDNQTEYVYRDRRYPRGPSIFMTPKSINASYKGDLTLSFPRYVRLRIFGALEVTFIARCTAGHTIIGMDLYQQLHDAGFTILTHHATRPVRLNIGGEVAAAQAIYLPFTINNKVYYESVLVISASVTPWLADFAFRPYSLSSPSVAVSDDCIRVGKDKVYYADECEPPRWVA